MNNKGFTLVELLAVVTIIGLISLLVIPNITENINNKKNEINKTTMKLIGSAADIYIENNKDRYVSTYEANGSTYCIPIQNLIDEGVLTTPFKDASGNEIDYTKIVKATYTPADNGFSYELVNTSDCNEIINYVSRPELTENMIPVIYDETINKWKKADVNSKWYNYSNQKWANIILVREVKSDNPNSKSRYEYINANPGTEIEQTDILAQFVWIPRFRYRIFNGAEQEISIAFESTTTPKSRGIREKEWLTHPAFTQNGEELSGIWVAKYESSNDNNNIIINSNQTPWNNIDYNRANEASINMVNQNNIYGLKDENTHMIKNSEWSAVTYLTNSKYGINEQINPSNETLTGNSISTTNNITGIFDMSGISKEFVNTKEITENDLGQSLIETKNWYNDENTFETTEKMYIVRGNTSIFNYENSKSVNENTSFRVSLTNSKNKNQDYIKPYTITFDPYGGSVGETTKEVKYGQTYGELPTPTREGYTFMGWRGKNMFDEDNTTNNKYVTFQDNLIIFDASSVSGNTGTTIKIQKRHMNNTYSWVLGDSYLGFHSGSMTKDDSFNLLYFNMNTSKSDPLVLVNINSLENGQTLNISYNVDSFDKPNAQAVISNFQIEEGDTATEYEPYQEYTSDTIVTKGDSHTLYAIWQQN